MKKFGLLAAVLVVLSAQTAAPSAPVLRHVEYQFGFNTKAANSGTGTGTTAIDITGPAADGGVMMSGTDSWWNSVRPRATNTCEVYPDGGITCMTRPYVVSPIQLVAFPLLAKHYFHGLGAAGTAAWQQSYKVNRGDLWKWNAVISMQGKGAIKNGGGAVLIDFTARFSQQGGHYRQATGKGRIAYDPVGKIAVAVSDTRTHLPQTSVYSNDWVDLKLIKDSQAGQ